MGDRILQFDGKAITSANQFGSILGTYPADWPVELVYQRREKKYKQRFRLEDMPFPKIEGGGMFGAVDPYGPHPVTRQADRRAVKRAFKMYQEAVGGAEAASSLKQIHMTGTRSMTGKSVKATKVQFNEMRKESTGLANRSTPVMIERAIRWALFESPGSLVKQGYRVIGADKILDRIAVVIEHKREDEPTFRLSFDDGDGRLLQIEFKDPTTRKRTRYEYDDYRRCGGMKLPHARRLFLDDKLYAVDKFKSIVVKG